MWLVAFNMATCYNQIKNGDQGVEVNKIIEFIWKGLLKISYARKHEKYIV